VSAACAPLARAVPSPRSPGRARAGPPTWREAPTTEPRPAPQGRPTTNDHGQFHTRVVTVRWAASISPQDSVTQSVVRDDPQLRPVLLRLKDRRLPLPRQILESYPTTSCALPRCSCQGAEGATELSEEGGALKAKTLEGGCRRRGRPGPAPGAASRTRQSVEFHEQATAGDYDHLLATSTELVEVP
jgi:hypothetical protein